MGKIEASGKQRKKRRDIKRAMLTAVKAIAVAGVLLTAPNVVGAMTKLGIATFDNDTSIISRARRQMLRSGLLAVHHGRLKLTGKGEAELKRIELRELDRHARRRWDGRWRILIFDIPEHRKAVREKIRTTVRSIGFFRLQDSVWVYPYDCEDFIILLKADFRIGKDVLYMIVDELEGDSWLREHFMLARK